MKQAVTVGLAVVAATALLEVALVPGILIGGAAVLAPRLLVGSCRPARRWQPNELLAERAWRLQR